MRTAYIQIIIIIHKSKWAESRDTIIETVYKLRRFVLCRDVFMDFSTLVTPRKTPSIGHLNGYEKKRFCSANKPVIAIGT